MVAEEEDEDICWSKTANGEYVAHLLAVSLLYSLIDYIKI
jgi:hypothetical protein